MNGVSRQAIDKRVAEGSLIAILGPSNLLSYPTFQFDPQGGLIAGIRDVQGALLTNNPWVVMDLLTKPNYQLDMRKPVDVLRQGNLDAVVAAAKAVGQQGF